MWGPLRPGIGPVSPVMHRWILSHWTPREVPLLISCTYLSNWSLHFRAFLFPSLCPSSLSLLAQVPTQRRGAQCQLLPALVYRGLVTFPVICPLSILTLAPPPHPLLVHTPSCPSQPAPFLPSPLRPLPCPRPSKTERMCPWPLWGLPW